MTTNAAGESTKDKLLKTSLELMWANSYGTVSVDDICKKAGVKKGSFYHFFPSKSDLAVAAFEEEWACKKTWYDQVFSSSEPPLERFRTLCREAVKQQQKKKSEIGYICGCPYATIGAELCAYEDSVRSKASEVIERTLTYYESSVREAVSRGDIPNCNPAKKARELYNYIIGCMTHARIANDIEALDELESGVMQLLMYRQEKK